MAEPVRTSSRRRARRRQRRRAFVIGAAILIVAAGAGTAWAMTRSSGPSYRLAAVEHANVAQTVDADGTIATINQSALSFATSGTVASVRVATGDAVRAGQVVATLDRGDLQTAVVSAQQTLADAKQKLADDEAAQTATATTASVTTAVSNPIRLVAAVTRPSGEPTGTPTGGTGGSGGSGGGGSGGSGGGSGSNSAVAAVKQAQRLVEQAQRELDDAITDQDVSAVASSCVETDGTPATVSTTASSGGDVTGTVGGSVVTVTLLDANGKQLAVQPPKNGMYTFTGLTAGAAYQVRVVTSDKVADASACAAALQTVRNKAHNLATGKQDLGSAVDALTKAVTALRTSGASGGSSAPTSGGSHTGTSSGSTGSGSTHSGTTHGTTSSNGAASSYGMGASSGGTSTTITAEQIVADQKSIDAAQAAVLVAKHDRGLSVLRAPIAGQVADLSISKGEAVGTSTTAMSVVGAGRKSVQVDVPLTAIELVNAGETAHVTVDGLTRPLAATVTQVGLINTSSSTGSAATYAVTIVLQQTSAHLYDGMGASVSIDVGTAKGVLSVPSSAVHTIGSFSAVDVYADGKVTAERVTLGVKGSDRVQVKSGLKSGQKVVLAVVSAAVPSSSSGNTTRFGGGGLTSGLGGGGAQRGAFFGGGTGS